MNWNVELLASAIWLTKAFVICTIGLFALAWGLVHWTSWGRQFKRITWSYLSPSRSLFPLGLLLLIIFFTLLSVRLNVLFSFWYNGFYSAMQKLDAKAFWFMLLIFAILATIHVGRSLLNYYLRQTFLIRWRVWLTQSLVDGWLAHQTYHRSQYLQTNADNPDQRIQQDVDSFVTSSLTLSMGLLDAVVSLFSFTFILWSLSGVLAVFGFEIPRAMVFLVYLYVIVATVFAVWLGKPLVMLNFNNEKFNANFRYALIRVREYGESIAFFGGENVERVNLLARFKHVISNMWAIVFRSLKFDGFNLGVSQAAVVFPFIVQAPRLFSKQITLGDMMQTAQAFGQVQEALSFFRSSYDTFASYKAVLNRLTGFLEVMESVETLPVAQIEVDEKLSLSIQDLTVHTPANQLLINKLSIILNTGAALIIRGASGAGKTTLLRAIAGLWPFVEGKVVRPAVVQCLFLPQKPYLPLGTLRTALYYPSSLPKGQDNLIPSNQPDQANVILQQCQLGHLASRLDEESDWTSQLSLGEQQRLAIGRALLSPATLIFLDEASSAMDEGLEHAMYQLLRGAKPNAILVSVGHRSSLLAFHSQSLDLMGEGKWALSDLSKVPA